MAKIGRASCRERGMHTASRVQVEDGIRDFHVTGVQTCALPILLLASLPAGVMAKMASQLTWLQTFHGIKLPISIMPLPTLTRPTRSRSAMSLTAITQQRAWNGKDRKSVV